MKIDLYNGDCLEVMPTLPDASVDMLLTDPPYKYLKNQKLETDFDEDKFCFEASRVLKPDATVIVFGRGVSFWRLCTKISDTGFACINQNRNFIGIELDKEYFQIGQKRINEAKAQTKLF